MIEEYPSRITGQVCEYMVRSKLASIGLKTVNADTNYDILITKNLKRVEVKSSKIQWRSPRGIHKKRGPNGRFIKADKYIQKPTYQFQFKHWNLEPDACDFVVCIGWVPEVHTMAHAWIIPHEVILNQRVCKKQKARMDKRPVGAEEKKSKHYLHYDLCITVDGTKKNTNWVKFMPYMNNWEVLQ